VSFEPAEYQELVLLVGNAESGFEADVRTKLAEQLRTEGMDRSALHSLDTRAEVLETRGDLVGRLVGEGENADSVRLDSKILDEESNALDEAKGLPCTGAGEDEDRP
jgi:hypothetical protein